MSDDVKRPRGRPKGTGKDDSIMLAKVADMVIAENIRPTTAMKRQLRANTRPEERSRQEHEIAATLRRLQDKWKNLRDELLAAARRRMEKRELEARRRNCGGSGGYFSATDIPRVGAAAAMAGLGSSIPKSIFGEDQRGILGLVESPVLKHLMEQNEAIWRAVSGVTDNSVLKYLTEQNEAARRAISGIGGSSAQKYLMEQNEAARRAIYGTEESPHMKYAREQEEAALRRIRGQDALDQLAFGNCDPFAGTR